MINTTIKITICDSTSLERSLVTSARRGMRSLKKEQSLPRQDRRHAAEGHTRTSTPIYGMSGEKGAGGEKKKNREKQKSVSTRAN